MTHKEFIQCWNAACEHRHASFVRETSGAHLFGTWWRVKVGAVELTIMHAPYIEGRHDRADIRPWAYINGNSVIEDRIPNASALPMVKLWERKQNIDPDISAERILEHLRT